MICLQISEIKNFMNTLLRTETFDKFLLQEATITNAVTYTINGQLTKDFYTNEELKTLHLMDCRFLPFSMLRKNCFDLIKGKRTPHSFRFVFLLSPEHLKKTVTAIGSNYTTDDISAIYMNLKYENHTLHLTTGVSYRIFSMDKTLENEWDKMVMKFLKQHGLVFEIV
ncbi:MAG: hypothetical protein IKJ01_00330 [Lachnospiraceae bacterium]|nr:hypothetical protein [Lachnospiraceae bacterium]